jgi:hypothetical protein
MIGVIKMKYTQIKQLKAFCDNLTSSPDWKEVLNEVISDSDDFEVDNVRFIKASEIDQIQQDELLSDLYCLGCFNANFLSGHIALDADVIKAIQDAGAYEAIGKIASKEIESIQSEYSRLDGYGHHFNHYDFSEENITINGIEYYVFDNR